MNSVEEWRSVVGYEGYYEVSDQGRVRSVARTVPGRWNAAGTRRHGRPVPPRILRPTFAKRTGHHRVKLCRDGRGRTVTVHSLVLLAFVGPRPEGFHGCHNDGDVNNNTLSNLRWDTPSENALDAVRHGRNFLANRTHCAAEGHPFDEANTYLAPNGSRKCRTCRAEASRRYLLRRNAVAA